MEEIPGINVPVKIWAPVSEVEPEALVQLKKTTALPWVYHHVAAMPDVHSGKGATVGSVIAMKDALSPACVGVDIGCGMAAVPTNLMANDLPDNLESLRASIEEAIPVGFNGHKDIVGLVVATAWEGWSRFHSLTPKAWSLWERARQQVGTLGGGNHFIEVCLDTLNRVWIMLHSGSRNIGKTLAEIHIARAKDLAHNERLMDPELAVFLAGTPEMDRYRHDLYWAQDYALLNRTAMLHLIHKVMRKHFPQYSPDNFSEVHCHHNYVMEETHFGNSVYVTRKGAISANVGEMGIIPGAMGAKSYIVRGKGNPEAYNSASHGAGRRMSRGAAKRNFTVEDLAKSTEGVCCKKDASVLDEISGAYKDIDAVMKNQQDLVEVVEQLRGILVVKG